MTPTELLTACNNARAQGLERLVLVIMRKREPRGERVRLAPGLFGRLIGSDEELMRTTGLYRVLVDVKEVDARRFAERAIVEAIAGGAP